MKAKNKRWGGRPLDILTALGFNAMQDHGGFTGRNVSWAGWRFAAQPARCWRQNRSVYFQHLLCKHLIIQINLIKPTTTSCFHSGGPCLIWPRRSCSEMFRFLQGNHQTDSIILKVNKNVLQMKQKNPTAVFESYTPLQKSVFNKNVFSAI